MTYSVPSPSSHPLLDFAGKTQIGRFTFPQARRKSTKINFLAPETTQWGGGLPREGVVAEKFMPSLESLSSLGFESLREESGMSREFCRDVPDPGVFKTFVQKKFVSIFRSLFPERRKLTN